MGVEYKKIEYSCDYPGCNNALSIKGYELYSDYDWESRSGERMVCDEHRFTTSDELEALSMGDVVLCPNCKGKAARRWNCGTCGADGYMFDWQLEIQKADK